MLVSKKIKEERIKLVIENFNIAKEREKIRLSYISKKIGDPLACMSGCGSLYEYKASKNLLFDKDLEQFKQDIYIYAKLKILSSDSRKSLFGSGLPRLYKSLMSNNKELINFYIRYLEDVGYKNDKYAKSNADTYLAVATALALKGDWEEVIKRADTYLNDPSKSSYHKYTYLGFEFLKALALKDIEKMKKSINEMLDIKVAKKMLNDMCNAFDFYLNFYVIAYAKVALYHGIDLGIDNEMAPKEIIDITPAKEYYEPYDFMKKFDLNTITQEEWFDWICDYSTDKDLLEKRIEKGFI